MHGYSAIEAADDTPRLIPKEAYDQLVSAIYTQRVGR